MSDLISYIGLFITYGVIFWFIFLRQKTLEEKQKEQIKRVLGKLS